MYRISVFIHSVSDFTPTAIHRNEDFSALSIGAHSIHESAAVTEEGRDQRATCTGCRAGTPGSKEED